MAKKPADNPNRPSLQLLVDRELVQKFRGLCMIRGTTMSKQVTEWIVGYLREAGIEFDDPDPKPRRPK